MVDTAHECYVVAAELTGHFVEPDFRGGACPIKVLPVFSSRDAARKRIPVSETDERTRPKEVARSELKHILDIARHEGYTHVALDGREMRIDGFELLLEHEQLE